MLENGRKIIENARKYVIPSGSPELESQYVHNIAQTVVRSSGSSGCSSSSRLQQKQQQQQQQQQQQSTILCIYACT